MHGFWNRIKYAFLAFFTILFKGRLPAGLREQMAAEADTAAPPGARAAGEVGPAVAVPGPVPAAAPSAPPQPDPDRAVQILTLLQRDGRLVDFLMEDLASYSDAQIGAGVRELHDSCRKTLERYVTLEAIRNEQEGQPITVTSADPAAVRLLGNVTGQPPFRGTLLHRGWRATRVELPPLPDGTGRRVVAQAEVEVA